MYLQCPRRLRYLWNLQRLFCRRPARFQADWSAENQVGALSVLLVLQNRILGKKCLQRRHSLRQQLLFQ